MTYTQLKLKPVYRERLQILAEAHGRSMANTVERLIDDAFIHGQPYELSSYGEAYVDGSRNATLRLIQPDVSASNCFSKNA